MILVSSLRWISSFLLPKSLHGHCRVLIIVPSQWLNILEKLSVTFVQSDWLLKTVWLDTSWGWLTSEQSMKLCVYLVLQHHHNTTLYSFLVIETKCQVTKCLWHHWVSEDRLISPFSWVHSYNQPLHGQWTRFLCVCDCCRFGLISVPSLPLLVHRWLDCVL